MAAAWIGLPGSEFGPCVNTQCGHEGCRAMREWAASACRICGRPINYERCYFDEWCEATPEDREKRGRNGFLVHSVCLQEEVERRQRGIANHPLRRYLNPKPTPEHMPWPNR